MKDNIVNLDLAATGLFRTFTGPAGGYPVQLEGTLTTGEFVYFRARGQKASLTVSHTDDLMADPIVRYEEVVTPDDPQGASTLPVERCVALIKAWLGQYLAARQS